MYRIVNPNVQAIGPGAWHQIYKTVDDALAAAEHDDVILITAGTYTPPTGDGWAITKRLTIIGESAGAAASTTGTVLSPKDTGNGVVFDLTTQSGGASVIEHVVLKNLKFRPSAFTGTTRPGPVIKARANSGKVQDLHLERLIISGCESDAFSFIGANLGLDAILFLRFIECVAVGNKGIGFHIKNATVTHLIGCSAGGNDRYGYLLEDAPGIRLFDCNNEANWKVPDAMADPNVHAGIRITSCDGFGLLGMHNEEANPHGNTLRTFISVDQCYGGVIDGGVASNLVSRPGSRGIRLGGQCRAVRVGPMGWGRVETLVEIVSPGTANVVEPQVMASVQTGEGQIIIPDGVNLGNFAYLAPANGSVLGLGQLLPPWDDSGLAAVSVPRRGTVVYNSNYGTVKTYDGSRWSTVGLHTARASLTNQSGTIAPTVLVASPMVGMYRVTVYLVVTTIGGASSTVKAAITWNDGTAGRSIETANVAGTATNFEGKEIVVRVGTAGINYSTTVVNPGSSMRYSLYIRLEPLE